MALTAPTLVGPYAGMPVAVYLRASDDSHSKSEKSVNDQKPLGLEWVDRNGALLHDVYCDNDKSGSRFARKPREEFNRLVADVRAGHIRIIWFWTLSRSQRKMKVFIALRDLSRELRVLWVVDGSVRDLNNRGDRIALGVNALLDEELPEIISEGVRRGLESNATAGKPHRRRLFGYRRLRDPDTGKYAGQVRDETRAPVVVEAARRFAAGEPALSIANDLNARGVETPEGKGWSYKRVVRMVTNPGYVGLRVHHEKVHGPADWDAILDVDTHIACVRRAGDPTRRTTERQGSIRHLMSGVMLCGVCAEPVAAQQVRGIWKYACRGRRPGPDRGHTATREDWVDDYIREHVVGRLSRPDARELLAPPSQRSEARAALTEAGVLRVRLDEAMDMWTAGEIDRAELARVKATLRAGIAAAERKFASLSASAVLLDAVGPDAAHKWDKVWPLPRRREIARELMEVRLLPAFSRTRRFDPDRVEITWRHAG